MQKARLGNRVHKAAGLSQSQCLFPALGETGVFVGTRPLILPCFVRIALHRRWCNASKHCPLQSTTSLCQLLRAPYLNGQCVSQFPRPIALNTGNRPVIVSQLREENKIGANSGPNSAKKLQTKAAKVFLPGSLWPAPGQAGPKAWLPTPGSGGSSRSPPLIQD